MQELGLINEAELYVQTLLYYIVVFALLEV